MMDKTEKAKLKILLSHWVEHNQEHAEEFSKWAEKASDGGEVVVGRDMLEAVRHMGKANEFLQRALEKLSKVEP
jgi:hypothetical protein